MTEIPGIEGVAPPKAPEPPKPAEPPTGFHFYDGKEVAVQLIHEYFLGRNKEGREVGTHVLVGRLAIRPGITPGSYLFILAERQPEGHMHYVSIYPEDVRHLTHAVENRLVAP